MSNGNYVAINNYSSLGKMGISRRALEGLANRAVASVAAAKVSKKAASFQAEQGARVTLSRSGKVTIHVDVSITRGTAVDKVCLELQKAIAGEIELSCDTVPYDIRIRVVKVGV